MNQKNIIIAFVIFFFIIIIFFATRGRHNKKQNVHQKSVVKFEDTRSFYELTDGEKVQYIIDTYFLSRCPSAGRAVSRKTTASCPVKNGSRESIGKARYIRRDL